MKRFFGSFFSFFGVVFLAVLLVSSLLVPAVGALGVGTRSASDAFLSLPSQLPEIELPTKSKILAMDGSLLATVFLQDRQPVKLEQVNPQTVEALLAIEDSRFYEHNGVDAKGLARAFSNNAQGGNTQGASTLTQQYVKNALLLSANNKDAQKAATAKSVSRKLREARYALQLEKNLSKNQILEGYFNIAYFGDGAYGIQAASLHFFSKNAKDLTLPESALLAGLVQNPSRFDPTEGPEALKRATVRRDLVLKRMLDLKKIDMAEYKLAKESPIALKVAASSNGCETSFAPFFCDWVRGQLENNPALGATKEERIARLLEGGLTITTTLDPKVQKAAQDSVDSVLGRDNRVASAAVVIQPGTGEVRAMAVNRTYGKKDGETEFPLATNPSYQAGSTFKMFTLVTALSEGLPLSTTLAGGDCYQSKVFKNPPSGCFRNAADGEGGLEALPQATWNSVNTWYVQLQEKVGVLNVAETARAMGISSLPKDGKNAVSASEGSFTLGAREVSPLEMSNAYATLAAHGKYCAPQATREIRDSNNNRLSTSPRKCRQAISPEVADTASSVLEGVITDGTGKRASIARPAAGKTGTTSEYGAAWFVGFTPDLATGVWVGDPRGLQFPLRNVRSNFGRQARVFGGGIPAQIWKETMMGALEGVPVQNFVGPDANIAAPAAIRVPLVTGLDKKAAEGILAASGFKTTVQVGQKNAVLQPGVVLSQKPVAGTPVTDPGDVIIVLNP